ncbi:hypothetical protein F5Y14DRAFT_391566 [Nemania sp. NC0429]|nr:hypothetical protein F5Y14DRAFT_391566 [Nemania sp. NC0429]
MDGAVATLSEVKAKAFQAVQTSFKDSALTGLRPTIGETRGSSGHQPMKGGRDTQNHPVATARLSAQCQLRHFNPKWQETVGPKGFKCSVQLRDKVIHGDHAYPTPNDAKQAVAEKALGFVRRLPRYESAQKGTETVKSTERADTNGDRNRVGRAQAKAEPIAIAGLAGLHGQYAYAAPVPTNVNYNWGAYNTTEQAALLHRMQSIVGSVGPSPAVLSDPLAAQAFLQGLAVGASVRAAGAACDPYFEPQARPFPMATSEVYRHYDARERSPAPTDGRNYRDRSSPDQGTSHESRPRRFK